MNQVGCVYTAQGFEFDYVGVIWGRDLRWDPATTDWISARPPNVDPGLRGATGEKLKQTYRVLLTRGLKGCYVYFEDGATRLGMSGRPDGDS